MDNWLSPILFLILGYLLGFTRPWVKSAYKRSVFVSRKKRIQVLISDYGYVKVLNSNIELLAIVSIKAIIKALLEICFQIVIIGAVILTFTYWGRITPANYWIPLPALFLITGSVFNNLTQARDTITNSIQFDMYKEKTIKKLIKLGGNPEDLDKEESEG
jgi:hypothetical protein